MKAAHLLTSLAWTSLASAAPLARTAVLIAGSATKTISLEAVHHNAALGQHLPHALSLAAPHHPPATAEQHPSVSLDSEHPLTTVELMALSANAPSVHISNAVSPEQIPDKPKAIKTKVSVGALVAPSSNGEPQRVVQFVDQGSNVKTYLIPVYFISTQRIDTLVMAAILTLLLVVIAFEMYNLAVRFGTYVFGEEESAEMQLRKHTDSMIAMEDGASCESYSDDEDATMAPFSGFKLSSEQGRLKLPRNLDEKASLI